MPGLTPVIGLTGILSLITIDHHDFVEVSDGCQRIGEISSLKNCCCSSLADQEYLARAKSASVSPFCIKISNFLTYVDNIKVAT